VSTLSGDTHGGPFFEDFSEQHENEGEGHIHPTPIKFEPHPKDEDDGSKENDLATQVKFEVPFSQEIPLSNPASFPSTLTHPEEAQNNQSLDAVPSDGRGTFEFLPDGSEERSGESSFNQGSFSQEIEQGKTYPTETSFPFGPSPPESSQESSLDEEDPYSSPAATHSLSEENEQRGWSVPEPLGQESRNRAAGRTLALDRDEGKAFPYVSQSSVEIEAP